MRGAGVALLALLAMAAPAADSPSVSARIALNGRVLTRGSNEPIPNARVVAARVNGAVEDYRSTTSDSRGWFRFNDLTAGSYRIHADAVGYLRSEFGRPPVAPAGTPIELVEGGTPPDAIISMTRTGVIAGRVTDRGRAAAGVWVRALKTTYRDGQRYLSVEEYAVTDDRGDYRLFELPPGSYLVSAVSAGRPRLDGETLVTPAIPSNANGNRTEMRTPATLETITAAAFEPGVAVPVYYPNTTDLAAAAPINISAGSSVLAIDLTLTRSATFHVRGRIETQGLTGAPMVRVSVFPIESGGGPAIPEVEAIAGTFDLPGVPPGRYHLSARVVPAPGDRTAASAPVMTRVPVEVWDRDLDGVVALLQPGVTITGRVHVDGAVPATPPFVQLIGLNGLPGTGSRRVEADGSFTIPNVALGDYRWRLIPFGGAANGPLWPKAARFGSDDASARVISVGPDAPTRRFEIDVSTRTAILETVVVDSRQRPLQGVLVVAVPDPARRTQSDAYRTGVTGADGRVRFEGMPPGDYLLFATETIPADAWQDPAVLKQQESKGRPATLREATRVVVTCAVTS